MSTNAQTDSSANEANSGHRTAHRVLDILEVLADAQGQGDYALRDLSAALNAPKSSILPLLRTLTGRGYITRDAIGNYRLGPKALELGMDSLSRLDLREIARPALLDLAGRTGESTILATLTGDKKSVIYIDKVESRHRIRAAAAIGELRPLHSTASGKVLLAFMPPTERDAILADLKLVRYTPATVTSKPQLRAELERIRTEGVSVNIDQSILGHCAIAAPILDHQSMAVAAFVLSVPTERGQDKLPWLTEEVKAAARSISILIGYRDKLPVPRAE